MKYLFLFFFSLPLTAQITVTGKVTNYYLDKEQTSFIYTDTGKRARIDKNGLYSIEVKQWDVIKFYEPNVCFVVIENAPKQTYNTSIAPLPKGMICVEYTYTCGICFFLDGKPVKEENREQFKENLRKGVFAKYTLLVEDKLKEKYGYFYSYGVDAYTKEYLEKQEDTSL
ncbi:hypothetical protein RCZ04_01130 [Capnocytophaga sp. HP1101]